MSRNVDVPLVDLPATRLATIVCNVPTLKSEGCLF